MENQNPTTAASNAPQPVTTDPVNNSATQTSLLNPIKRSSKFSIKAIISTIIFLLLAGGAAAGYMYRDPILNLVTNQKTQSCSLEAMICPDGSSVGRSGPSCAFSPCPTASKDPISDWDTFEGSGFSFKHPLKLAVNQNEIPSEVITPHNDFWLFESASFLFDPSSIIEATNSRFDTVTHSYNGIQLLLFDKTFQDKLLNPSFFTEEIYNSLSESDQQIYNPKIESVKVNEYTWLRVINSGEIPINYYIIKLPNNKILVLNRIDSTSESFKELFDQILSTFKFTDLPSIDTTDWKTYKSDKFEFNHRNDLIPSIDNSGNVFMQYREPLPSDAPDGYELSPGYRMDFKLDSTEGMPLNTIISEKIAELKGFQAEITTPISPIKIGEYSGFTFTGINQIDFQKIFLLSNSNTYIEISYSINDKNSKGYKKEIDFILSTFKFTD